MNKQGNLTRNSGKQRENKTITDHTRYRYKQDLEFAFTETEFNWYEIQKYSYEIT